MLTTDSRAASTEALATLCTRSYYNIISQYTMILYTILYYTRIVYYTVVPGCSKTQHNRQNDRRRPRLSSGLTLNKHNRV